MKTYKVAYTTKIFVIFSYSFILILGLLFIIYNSKASILEKAFDLIVLVLGFLSVIAMYHLKINTDDQKLEMFMLEVLAIILGKIPLGITHQVLNWDEIGELNSTYVLFAETPIITLIPKPTVNKKPIEFMGFPLELVKDILSHLPPDAKVNLYPYLKRKLEGKQAWFYVK